MSVVYGPETIFPVSESQIYISTLDADAKYFSSGEKATELIRWFLWYIESNMHGDQLTGLPLESARSWGNRGRKCLATAECSGAKARAEMYMWGALWEIGWINDPMNRRASWI